MLQVRNIKIIRDGDYEGSYGSVDFSRPLIAKIKVQNQSTEMQVTLSEGASSRLINLIAQELADGAREAAQAMTADVFTVGLLEAPLPKEVADDEIPF